MAEQLQLEVVTPERRVLSEQVNAVTVPGRGGEMGILRGHAPLISELLTGVPSALSAQREYRSLPDKLCALRRRADVMSALPPNSFPHPVESLFASRAQLDLILQKQPAK